MEDGEDQLANFSDYYSGSFHDYDQNPSQEINDSKYYKDKARKLCRTLLSVYGKNNGGIVQSFSHHTALPEMCCIHHEF